MTAAPSPLGAPAGVATIQPAGVARYSGRWAEAALLGVALVLGLGGFVLTALNRTGSSPAQTVGVAIAFLVLTVLMHLCVRYAAPWADPVLLPTAVALNGIGLAMIRRLDLAYEANEQWQFYVGLDAAGRHPLRRHAPPAARLPAPAALGPVGHVVRPGLPRPALPALHRSEHQRRPHLDPDRPHELPAGRAVQGAAGGLLRLLPGGQPGQPGPGGPQVPVDEPAARPAPRTPVHRVGREHLRPGPPEGPGLLGPAVRPVRRRPVRGHRPALLAAHRCRPVPPGGLVRGHAPPSRPAAHQRLAPRHRQRRLQRRRWLLAAADGHVRHVHRRTHGCRMGQGVTDSCHLRQLRLHLRLAG